MLCTMDIFSANDLLTPVTPNDPRLTFDFIKSQEGLKLIHMYESYMVMLYIMDEL